jgi:hypothetical protein
MVVFPWQEILSEPGGQAVRQGGEVARRTFCELRRDYPYLFDATRLAAGVTLNTVLNNESLWNRVCRDVPLSAPVGAVVGGQCTVLYSVRCFLTNPQTGASIGSSLRSNVQGAIRRASAEEFPGSTSGTSSYRITIEDALGNVFVDSVLTNSAVRNAIRRIQIDRQDGLPDSCGNGTPVGRTIPPVPPTLPSTINVNQGDFTNVQSPVTYNDLDLGSWPDITFSPDITIPPYRYRALPEGLDIEVDPEFSLAFVPPVPVLLDPVVVGGITEILTTVLAAAPVINLILDILQNPVVDLEELERLIRCCSCGENDTEETSGLFTNVEGGSFGLPDGAVSVSLSMVGTPTEQTKIQLGSGSSPDVYYWGWYSFGGSIGEAGERHPLSFKENSIIVPENAKSFHFAAFYGNRASGSVRSIVRDCLS